MTYLDMRGRLVVVLATVIISQVGAQKINANERYVLEVGHGTSAIKEDVVLNCTYYITSSPTKIRAKWVKNEMGSSTTPETVVVVGEDKKVDGNAEWSYDGNMITSSYNYSKKGAASNAGIYICEFTDDKQKSLKITTIHVTTSPFAYGHFEPLIEKDYSNVRLSSSIILLEGDDEDLECQAKGFPKPTITWYRVEGTEEASDLLRYFETPTPLVDEANYVVTNGSYVHLTNARYKDRGYYACKAENAHHPPLVIFVLVRVKSRLAPIWPVIVLVSEVVILGLILGLCEWHRRKTSKDEEGEDGAKAATSVQNANSGANVGGSASQVRQRQAASGGGKR